MSVRTELINKMKSLAIFSMTIFVFACLMNLTFAVKVDLVSQVGTVNLEDPASAKPSKSKGSSAKNTTPTPPAHANPTPSVTVVKNQTKCAKICFSKDAADMKNALDKQKKEIKKQIKEKTTTAKNADKLNKDKH